MLAKRSPSFLRVLDQIGKEGDWVSSLIDDLYHFHGVPTVGGLQSPAFSPLLDFVDEKDKYVVSIEVPGVKKEDISIEIEEDILVVKGEKKVEKVSSDKYVSERYFGSFRREIKLPNNSNINNIEAKYDFGILYLTIPKIIEKEKEIKKIKIV